MAILNVQRPTVAGVEITMAAAAPGGDSFPNNGNTTLIVANGGGGSINVTVNCGNACSFGVTNDAHDVVVAIAAGATRHIGPFTQGRFNDGNGRVNVAYSGTTSVTVAAVSR